MRFTRFWWHYGFTALSGDGHTACISDHRELVVLSTIAGSAGKHVVWPAKHLLRIQVFGLDVFNFVSERILAINTALCASAHLRKASPNRTKCRIGPS